MVPWYIFFFYGENILLFLFSFYFWFFYLLENKRFGSDPSSDSIYLLLWVLGTLFSLLILWVAGVLPWLTFWVARIVFLPSISWAMFAPVTILGPPKTFNPTTYLWAATSFAVCSSLCELATWSRLHPCSTTDIFVPAHTLTFGRVHRNVLLFFFLYKNVYVPPLLVKREKTRRIKNLREFEDCFGACFKTKEED